jgi:hypothetical protein
MPRCPSCRCTFRVMEDEQNMHDCPSCGYGPSTIVACMWCSAEVTDDENMVDCLPYCSEFCSARAEAESMEDSE